jgi:simple sugar transport system permease protein
MGISDKVARLFQGMLLFFVLGCDTLILYKIRFVRSPGPHAPNEPLANLKAAEEAL